MTKAKPRLADVQCSRMQFQPGDRLLVKVRQDLSKEETRKLRKVVERWAGGVVEVLIINTMKMEIEVERAEIIIPE